MREQKVYISRGGRHGPKDNDIRIVLTEVIETLEEIKEKARQVRSKGYDPGNDIKSQWTYITKPDEAVCNVCRPLNGKQFSGPSIAALFPYAINIDETHIHPNTHAPRDLNCRCQLVFTNEDTAIENYVDGRLEI